MSKKYHTMNDAHVPLHTFIVFLLGIPFTVGIYGAINWDYAWGAIAVAALFAYFTFRERVKSHDRRAFPYVMEDPEPEIIEVVVSPDRNMLTIETAVSRQCIIQHREGAFARLIGGALSFSTREEFSLRRALREGWTEEEYLVLVAQMRAVGWIGDIMRNEAPVLADDKFDEIRDWLSVNELHSPYSDS